MTIRLMETGKHNKDLKQLNIPQTKTIMVNLKFYAQLNYLHNVKCYRHSSSRKMNKIYDKF